MQQQKNKFYKPEKKNKTKKTKKRYYKLVFWQ